MVRAAGRRVLRMAKTFTEDLIDGKSVGKAATRGVNELAHKHNKRKDGSQLIIPIKRGRRKQGCLSYVFNLFSMLPIQTSVIKGAWVEVQPTNSVEDGTPVNFEISGSGTKYFELANIFIKTRAQVTTPDGIQGFAVDAEVAPVNHLLHSMFSKVEVMLNGKTVCLSDYHYAYSVHIETLLNFGTDTKKCELTAVFRYDDTPNQFDTLINANTDFQVRKQLSVGCCTIPLMGRAHPDLFSQSRFIIDAVNVHVTLKRSPAAFLIMWG